MFDRVWRLMAVAAAALSLSACIISTYDISAELKPEFPVKPGSYVNKEGNIVDVRKLANEYRVYSRKGKDVSYARLFKIPEYSDYLFQFYDRKEKKIYYFFVKMTEKGFDFYYIDKLPSTLPPHVAKLLNDITDDDRRYNTVTVKDGKRDTLYVIRELSRTNPNMVRIEKDSYERVTKPQR